MSTFYYHFSSPSVLFPQRLISSVDQRGERATPPYAAQRARWWSRSQPLITSEQRNAALSFLPTADTEQQQHTLLGQIQLMKESPARPFTFSYSSDEVHEVRPRSDMCPLLALGVLTWITSYLLIFYLKLTWFQNGWGTSTSSSWIHWAQFIFGSACGKSVQSDSHVSADPAEAPPPPAPFCTRSASSGRVLYH